MDTQNDIELYELETIEDNFCTDEAAQNESHEDSLYASASAFMIP
jgi:hypothetical protein